MFSKLRWCAGMEPVQAGARHLGQVKSSRIRLVFTVFVRTFGLNVSDCGST